MYQIEAWSALRRARRRPPGGVGRLRVHPNVWALGFTSLFTDVSSEMVGTVLPVYLVVYLGITPFQFGIVDGLYHGVTAVLRLTSGVAADRSGRCKELALAGYGVSALSRLGLLVAGASWPLIAAVVALDRLAKGARTVPRDLLISLSSRPQSLAAAFGVHRALDSAGAMLGPLIALAILAALPDAFDVVFVTGFFVAVCGLGVLGLFVDNVVPDRPAVSPPVPPMTLLRDALRRPGILRLVGASTALGAATVSDAFLYLLVRQDADFDAGLFPLLYVGTAAWYLVLAVPAGHLADRIGRTRAFLGGYVLLGTLYLAVLQGIVSPLGILGCLFLLGAHYALTDGVLMALASAWLPPVGRGSGLALLTTSTSLARLGGSVVFGALWTLYGTRLAVTVFTTMLGVALIVAGIALHGRRAHDDNG